MTKDQFRNWAEIAARELLAQFCDKHAEEQRVKPHGFHQGHVEDAAAIIVKRLWEGDDGR